MIFFTRIYPQDLVHFLGGYIKRKIRYILQLCNVNMEEQ